MDADSGASFFSWMAWTPATAAFFAAIALTLTVYSVLGVRWPSVPRQGFLPMPTTRGDRLFVGLLGAAFLNLLWASVTDVSQWLAVVVWFPFLLVVGRWG